MFLGAWVLHIGILSVPYQLGKPPEVDLSGGGAPAAPNKQQMALRAPPPSPVGASGTMNSGSAGGTPQGNTLMGNAQGADPRLVAATLPPKVPPKPPVVKALPEAQPLLTQGATATLGRVVLRGSHNPHKMHDGVV